MQTKLFVPRLRPFLVPRPHLIKQLNKGCQLGCKLTLISAPAGFGKSTLLIDWVQQAKPNTSVAWLSLDDGDNDLIRFLTYFIAALQTIKSHIGQGAMMALRTQDALNIEGVLTTLLNEINEFTENIVLVLDNYHVIESPPVDKAISFLLEHLLPQMHLVITAREDPNLPLARLRVRGLLNEIRAADLRFAVAETAVPASRNSPISKQASAEAGCHP